MRGSWSHTFQLAIWISGGFFTLTLTLGWLKMVKRYWVKEMNRESKRDKGDANE